MGDELTITKTGETRQQIVDTAEAIILGNGFTAVGLNEILCSAGVSEGSFYHYFKSKEQFGDALLEDYLSQLVLALKDNGSNISSRLMAFFPSWLDSQSCDDTSDKCLVVKLSQK